MHPLFFFLHGLALALMLIFTQEMYYKSRIDRGVIKQGDVGLYVFASKPSSGAAILRL